NGPIGAAKVGYKDGQYLLNPTATELKESQLELVVAGTADAVLMVESEASLLSEEVMLGAVMFGHEQLQVVINAINEFVAEAGAKEFKWTPPPANDALVTAIRGIVGNRLSDAFEVRVKAERKDAISALRNEVQEGLAPQCEANGW